MEWWETYEDRSPISYPRRDGGPVHRAGKHVEYKDGLWRSRPIHILTTRRAWKKP